MSTIGKTFLNSANVINLRHKVGRLNSYTSSIQNRANFLVIKETNRNDGPRLHLIMYDGSLDFVDNGLDSATDKMRRKIILQAGSIMDSVTMEWTEDDYSSTRVSRIQGNMTSQEPYDQKYMMDLFIITSNKPLQASSDSGFSFQDLTEYLQPDYNIDDATNTNALHTIELIHESSSSNTFTFQALVDSRACDNRLFVTFDSNSPLSANYKSDVTHDDITFYVYDLTLNLDVFGEKEETIVIKYGGDEVFSKPFNLNNTTAPAPSVEDDIFYLRTLDNYIDFVLETNSKNLYQEVDAYRLLDNSNQATVKEFPSYYKRFEEELDGYSQPRYRYTFRFPSESFESEMFLRGQIDFSDGTQMTSNNMIDYQLKTWGDTGEYVDDSPIYDNLPDIDNEQVNDTINDAKTTYTQTVQEMEQSPFGQKMKAFFGANWLLMLIGIIVFVVVLWG